jgi:hypothetical protein
MAHEIDMGLDGILRTRLIGELDRIAMDALLKDLQPYFEAATENAQLNLIMDSSQVGTLSSYARKRFTLMNQDTRIGKIAILGASRSMRVFIGFVSKATLRDNIQMFDRDDQAINWIKDKR